MPKRFAVGTSLGLFVRRLTRKAPKAARMSRSPARRELIETLENRRLLSTTYFVAPWGNDWAAGNIWQPFRTIQHAAQIANHRRESQSLAAQSLRRARQKQRH